MNDVPVFATRVESTGRTWLVSCGLPGCVEWVSTGDGLTPLPVEFRVLHRPDGGHALIARGRIISVSPPFDAEAYEAWWTRHKRDLERYLSEARKPEDCALWTRLLLEHDEDLARVKRLRARSPPTTGREIP